ncbi:MYND finger domain-containing protein [Hirsutella rhossiliensis]
MATCNVSVEFWCEFGATELKYKHSIPKTLVTQWIRPILREHEAACRKAAGCAARAAADSQRRFYRARYRTYTQRGRLCSWSCRRSAAKKDAKLGRGRKCRTRWQRRGRRAETRARRKCKGRMRRAQRKVCRGCGEMAGARRCSRCLTVAYCSRQHQKEDWKVHKKGCKPKAS